MQQIARGIVLDPDYLGADGDAVTLSVDLRAFLSSRGFNRSAVPAATHVQHVQAVASEEWVIPHNFSPRPPNVVLQDETGAPFLTDLVYETGVLRVLLPGSPTAGTAWLT